MTFEIVVAPDSAQVLRKLPGHEARNRDHSDFGDCPGPGLGFLYALPTTCGRQAPLPDSAWTPDAAVIRQLEEALPAALQDALNRETPANSVHLDASDYYRQYGGLVTGGRRILYVNGFHRKALDLLAEFPKGARSWQTSPVVVCDGGRWYFGAESDSSTRRAGLVTFN